MEDLIKALGIFLKYGNKTYPTNCSHDVLYVDIDPALVSNIDKEALDELGFRVEGEYEYGFISSKYGSC